MAGDPLRQACRNHRDTNTLLDERRVQVMSALLPGPRIGPPLVLREDPLPSPLGGRVGVFAIQRAGKRRPAPAVGTIPIPIPIAISISMVSTVLQPVDRRGP